MEETRYAMGSLEVMATKNLGQVVRAHWKRENNLHWVLDYVFDED